MTTALSPSPAPVTVNLPRLYSVWDGSLCAYYVATSHRELPAMHAAVMARLGWRSGAFDRTEVWVERVYRDASWKRVEINCARTVPGSVRVETVASLTRGGSVQAPAWGLRTPKLQVCVGPGDTRMVRMAELLQRPPGVIPGAGHVPWNFVGDEAKGGQL